MALIRNVFMIKRDDYSHVDVEKVLICHFKHYYSLGNVLFGLCLIFNNNHYLMGLNCVISLIALLVYFKPYYTHIKSTVQLKGPFNYIALTINISFVTAWNVCFMTITIATYLDSFNLASRLLFWVNIGLQAFLCALVVLTISYFYDIYFCFIILIFQIGNTLNKNLFLEAREDANISMFLTMFNTLCFFWTLWQHKKFRPLEVTEFIDEMQNNYLTEDKPCK